jgi:FkbM family methyltransferase
MLEGLKRRLRNGVRPTARPTPEKPAASAPPSRRLSSPTCQIKDLDALYLTILDMEVPGTFVEIGAFDGEYVSNTCGLADIGWKGLYVEPVPAYAEKCRDRHLQNSVKVLNVAAGAARGRCEITVGGPLSTSNIPTLERFRELGWAKQDPSVESIEVDVVPLDEILRAEGINPGFEVLSVDVEGSELEVFNGFDLRFWLPKVVIVELHDFNSNYSFQWGDADEIRKRLHESGYSVAWKDLTNTVFARR